MLSHRIYLKKQKMLRAKKKMLRAIHNKFHTVITLFIWLSAHFRAWFTTIMQIKKQSKCAHKICVFVHLGAWQPLHNMSSNTSIFVSHRKRLWNDMMIRNNFSLGVNCSFNISGILLRYLMLKGQDYYLSQTNTLLYRPPPAILSLVISPDYRCDTWNP